MFGKWPVVLRFSLAICPRASFLDRHAFRAGVWSSACCGPGTSLRGNRKRVEKALGKQNHQSLDISSATDELYQRPCTHARQQLERYPLPPLGTMAQQPRCTSSTHRAVPPACLQISGSVGHRSHGPSASSTLLRVCSAGCRRSSTANATHTCTRRSCRRPASRGARGPVTAVTWPTSQGATMPRRYPRCKMRPLTVAVSVRDCPARANPSARAGPCRSPNPTVTLHTPTRVSGRRSSPARRTRPGDNATRTIWCGGTRRQGNGQQAAKTVGAPEPCGQVGGPHALASWRATAWLATTPERPLRHRRRRTRSAAISIRAAEPGGISRACRETGLHRAGMPRYEGERD